MKPVRLTAAVNLTAAAGKSRKFEILAYTGGPLHVGGFSLPVIIDLAGLEVPESVPILADHVNAVDSTIGHTTSIENDGRSLVLAGAITTPAPDPGVPLTPAQQVVARPDHRWQASVGTMVTEQEEVGPGQLVTVNGQQFRGPVIVARRSRLGETSILAMGADSSTQVNLAARAAQIGETKMSFEQWVQDNFATDVATLSPELIALLQERYDQLQNGGSTAPAPATAAASAALNLRASAADEASRIAAVQAVAVGHPTIMAAAIRNGWNVEKTENAVLKSKLQKDGPTGYHGYRSGNGLGELSQEKVLVASLALNHGCRPDVLAKSSDIGERVVDAAMTLEHRGATLQTILRACMAAAGVTPPSQVVGDSWIRAGFEASRTLKASGFQTVNLPGILSSYGDKMLLNGFQSIPATWQNFCAVTSAPNFKPQKRYRLVTGNQFEEVAEGGSLKMMTFKPEEEYENQLKTYGCVLTMGRQTLINDDMGAFSKNLTAMGENGMKRLERSVYELLLASVAAGTFFTAGRGNYISGATTNLGTDGVGLTLGQKAFDNMVDVNGEPMMLVPEILLTGPTLSNNAKMLTRDTTVIAVGVDSTAKTSPNGNPHAGAYRPLKSPWIENALLTGNTATGWGLFAPPQGEAGLMEVGFLNGQRTPTAEEAELDFTQLGIAMRTYWDFGIAMSDYRFGVWSKGAS